MGQYTIDNSGAGIYPEGVTRTDDGIHVCVVSAADTCALLLFARTKNGGAAAEAAARIPFPPESRTGDVWEMTVRGEDLDCYDYAFEADGKPFPDPCGHAFTGREQWGKLEQAKTLLKTPLREPPFDWEGDCPLNIPYEDCIVYRAHVRGFTKHRSSEVEDKGMFGGIVEKIPYLQSLGITTLELLPVAEFQEVMMPETADGAPFGELRPTGKLNYWGYTRALAYAPKASYAGRRRNPCVEFKKLVKALHGAGIELVTEMYFDGRERPMTVLNAVRYWVREYHLDGVHLTGYAPLALLAGDPYLTDTKLWAAGWENAGQALGHRKHLAEFNDGFLTDMRRVLKGDEGQMQALAWRLRRNPAKTGVINYIAGTNGFTLMDMVSYEQKHNEANGERNHDGSDYNYTWNCGAEGPVRKKKILELRRRQLRNALLLVFLSQGTPLILAGDEFGNSQGGNNNAYCQDNETSWLNWKLLQTNADLRAFVRQAIAFRKKHPVFHMAKEPRVMDYLSCGHPDLSYHGVKAWVPEFDSFRRQLGVMYCGAYGRRPDGTDDDYFFVMYNMHWEPHEFALPNLPAGMSWHVAIDTSAGTVNGFYEEGTEPELAAQKKYMAPPRTVTVLIGRVPNAQEPVQMPEPEKRPAGAHGKGAADAHV